MPNLTDCFLTTIPIWIPTGWLLISFIYDCFISRKVQNPPLAVGTISVFKTASTSYIWLLGKIDNLIIKIHLHVLTCTMFDCCHIDVHSQPLFIFLCITRFIYKVSDKFSTESKTLYFLLRNWYNFICFNTKLRWKSISLIGPIFIFGHNKFLRSSEN